MPIGQDDYDVVIGVNIADHTAMGSASVSKNVNKMSDDIRKYGDRQARDFSRTTQDLLSQTDRHTSRSSSVIIHRLTNIFDQHNFLLRNMARQAGSTTGAIAIGVGKLALSWQKMGDVASITGSILEKSLRKQIESVSKGLAKAQIDFEKFRGSGSKSAESIAGKVNEVSASVSALLGGAKVDAPFFKSFIKARTETDKYLLVLDKLGPKAALAYSQNQLAVEKLSKAFVRLESRSAKAFKTHADDASKASIKVTNYKKELDLLDRALLKVTGGTDGAAASTGIFTSKMAIGSAAVGAFVVILLAAIVAAISLTVVIYKAATSAAKYGDEIYKLSLSTGLTVKTLSALSIIAKETNTDVDSLAKTFTRTQIQIQRGLDKPFSEAGRALRTLKVNFDELRKVNPDQQIFILAKAFTALNNQNVRATVAQQIFSRDAERQAKMLEQVANGFTIAQQKAKKFGLELDESGAVKAHLATVAAIDLKLAWEGLWVSLGIKILPQLTLLMESFVDMVLKSGGAFQFLGTIANFVLREIRINLEIIKETGFWEVMLGAVSPVAFIGNTAIKRSRAEGVINKEDTERQAEYERRIAELRRRGLQGDDLYAAGKGPRGSRSPMDRLEDQVKRLRFEIQALQDIGSKQFKLRFDLEELQKVKAGFESIFKLRTEMGLTLDEPVPQFRIFGSPEEQRADLANIQSYVKQMERMKTVFEGVRKVANEQADALGELARVQQEALMPLVDAGTLAEIKFQTAIRDRAKAEKELTADVIAESKIRKGAIEDEVGSTLKAYMSLQRDLGRSQDTIREQRKQDELFLKIIRGDLDTEQEIRDNLRERIGSTATPVVPTELMTIAAHAATIDLNVAAIAEKIGANVRNVSNTNISSPGSDSSYATQRLIRRNPDGSVTDVTPEIITTQTTDVETLRRRIFSEARQRAGGERVATERQANQEIIDNQMRMEQALISLDTDYLRHWTSMQVERRDQARETVVSIMILENDLNALMDENSQLYKDTWKEADRARLESLKGIRQDIIQLQNDIANNGFDQSSREEKAHLQAIRDIQEASNQARESIIYNQVKIADATVYHAEIADAAVMEFLANQRSITDVIADAKIAVIDSTFSAIDQGLEKITDKLGFAGDLVKDLLSGFIRLALSPFFKAIYGPQGGGGGGGGVGGIFGGGGGSGGIFGGGELPGVAPGGTPPFAGAFQALSGGVATPSSITAPGAFGGTGSLLGGGAGLQGLLSGGIGGGSLGARFGAVFKGLGGVLPFIGAGIGATAGGTSRFGSIVGGAGGLIAGGIGAAFLTPSIFAATGIFGSMGPAIAGLLTNPFTAVAAGALIVGALLLRRNAQRRQEETARNQVSSDTGTRLWQIFELVKTDQMDGNDARAEIETLHQKWIEFGNTLKDDKTRRHHFDTWSHFSVVINAINAAADEQIGRQNDRERMTPVFATGGWSRESQLIKVRPGEGLHYPGTNQVQSVSGRDKGYDTEFVYVPKGTRIYNRSEMQSAQGFDSGGFAGTGGMSTLSISSLELNIDADGIATAVIKSPHFKDAVIHNVRMGRKSKKNI